MADTKTTKAKLPTTDNVLELPKFDLTKMAQMDMPVAMREFAEKGVSQAKDAYDKIKQAAEETTDLIEDTYVTSTKGLADFNIKALEAMRDNVNATFDFTRDVLQVKTLSQAVELSTGHIRKQFETLIGQTRDLAETAQKLATEVAEPVKASVEKAIKPAA